jgi:hypothetical protein
MSKLRKRQHNPLTRLQRTLNDLRMWSWKSDFSDEGTRFLHIEAKLHPLMPYVPITDPALLEGIISYRFNWKICARVLCNNGADTWLESCETIAKQRRLRDVEHIYVAMKNEAMSSQQKAQIIDVGWIAQTFLSNPDSKEDWYQEHRGEVSEARQTLYLFAQEMEAA